MTEEERAMKTRPGPQGRVVLVLLAIALTAGCGDGGNDAPVTTTPATPATPATPQLTASDLAACAAYLRIEPKAVEALDGITSLPASASANIFGNLADDLDTGSGAADSATLVASTTKTSAALRAVTGRLEDFSSGDELDLTAEVTALFEQSSALALECERGDRAGSYRGIRTEG